LFAAAATTLALIAGSLAGATSAQAANPYERGPAPTAAALDASRGPFATAQQSVSSSVAGFGGGVIYYPTSTSEGTFGAVAISPGYTASWSSISWLGPRIASHGFVVIGIETNSVLDQPASRGDQLLAALDYLTRSSSVRTRIDASRLAVAGHSMGGGGSLEAAKDRPSLQAAVPLAPWNATKSWSSLRADAHRRRRERHHRAGVVALHPVLQQHPGVGGEGVPGARQRQPLLPADHQHADRADGGGLAQALRRRRHPLRPVHLPGAEQLGHLRLPQHLSAVVSARGTRGSAVTIPPAPDPHRGENPR
jgi:hypothetical protein